MSVLLTVFGMVLMILKLLGVFSLHWGIVLLPIAIALLLLIVEQHKNNRI